MYKPLATLFAATILLLAFASIAIAAPRAVQVRVEGKFTTIFDGTVLTEGHPIRAISDTVARICDTTNLGHTDTPQASATAATVDAMTTIGKGFDGNWFDGYEDFFMTQFGDDHDDDGSAEWWGVLLNWQFTPVGGCQQPVEAGDNVLWAYDAFSSKPYLKLNRSGPSKVVVGEPYAVTVVERDAGSDTEEGGLGETAHAGASVDVVDSLGRDDASIPATGGVSDGNGAATVTFNEAGWQRIKAREINSVSLRNDAIASNSLDVCVVVIADDECAGDPPSQFPRVPDLEAPQITVTEPLADSTTSSESAVLTYTVSDNYGLAPSCSSPSGTSVALDLGLNAVHLSCEDIFGNQAVRNVFVTRTAKPATPLGPPAQGTPVGPLLPRWLTAKSASLTCGKKCKKVKNKLAASGSVLRVSTGGSAKFKLLAGAPLIRIVGSSKRASVRFSLGRKSVKVKIPAGRKVRVIPIKGLSTGGTLKLSVTSGSVDLDAVAVSP